MDGPRPTAFGDGKNMGPALPRLSRPESMASLRPWPHVLKNRALGLLSRCIGFSI